MTTEPTMPQQELGSAPANGQGQSQGHRRRRRRRKNKPNQPNGQPQAQQQSPPQQVQPQMQAPQQPQQQGGPPKQGSGRHRKKKKFFQQKSGGAPQPGPGNSIAPQHNGRRKERQQGPADVCGSDGPQLSHRERQCRGWTSFDDSYFRAMGTMAATTTM